ncbi:MAG: hypothetical protein EBT86_09625 [Actinobacteria bacterium]|nr:hypothetical protein [Actinomycetota bacterium]
MDKKTRLDELAAWHIFQIIELHYQQGLTTTWRGIYEFLRLPESVYKDDDDLDEEIKINNDYELEQMRLVLESKFSTRH